MLWPQKVRFSVQFCKNSTEWAATRLFGLAIWIECLQSVPLWHWFQQLWHLNVSWCYAPVHQSRCSSSDCRQETPVVSSHTGMWPEVQHVEKFQPTDSSELKSLQSFALLDLDPFCKVAFSQHKRSATSNYFHYWFIVELWNVRKWWKKCPFQQQSNTRMHSIYWRRRWYWGAD